MIRWDHRWTGWKQRRRRWGQREGMKRSGNKMKQLRKMSDWMVRRMDWKGKKEASGASAKCTETREKDTQMAKDMKSEKNENEGRRRKSGIGMWSWRAKRVQDLAEWRCEVRRMDKILQPPDNSVVVDDCYYASSWPIPPCIHSWYCLPCMI